MNHYLNKSILIIFTLGTSLFTFAQGGSDLDQAIDMFHVEPGNVPSQVSGAGDMLKEFKRRMVLLDLQVQNQLKDAPAWQKRNAATPQELQTYKDNIIKASMQESLTLARRFRDPAMVRLVANANSGLPSDSKIALAGGTGPAGSSYRGGFGDIDLQGGSQAIKRFQNQFQNACVPEPTSNKPGYVSYTDIDITLHRMGRLGEVGSTTLQTQIQIDAGSKETYVSSAMLPNQVGKSAVLFQDHLKKMERGTRLTTSKLLSDPEALQSFAKGTAKCMDTAGLDHFTLARILKASGYHGSVASYKNKLSMIRSQGYDRAPGELDLDLEGMRIFKKTALAVVSEADKKTWSNAQSGLKSQLDQISKLRQSGDPVKRAEADSLKAMVDDTTIRLNEAFLANKNRFHWLFDRNKIQGMLQSTNTQKIHFISYLSAVSNGRRISLAFLFEQARQNPDLARQIVWDLPPHVRARLQQEADFKQFETELKQTALPSWNRKVNLPAFAVSCQAKIARVNSYLNQSIQQCALARGYAKGMSYYGKITEAESYYQAWQRGGPEELMVDIIRRRVPFMTSVELSMMGNYWLAGWDVVCTLIPPAGLFSAAAQFGSQIGQVSVDYLYTYELLDFEEELYRTAQFELTGVSNLESAKVGSWRLLSVAPEGHKVSREQLLKGWLSIPAGASILITRADPVLAALNEMMHNPHVGKRLLYGKDGFGGYMGQYLDRQKKVLIWWASRMIQNLEQRKTAQDAWARGLLPGLYAQLMEISRQLKVESDINAALDRELGTGMLDPLRQWVQDVTVRDQYIQGTSQSSLREELASRAVLKYLACYRDVLKARSRAEQQAMLKSPTDATIRILTGNTSLFVNIENDTKSAKKWFSFALNKKGQLQAKLTAIKSRYIDGANLKSPYDQEALRQILNHTVWLEAWTDAIRISQDRKTASANFGTQRRAWHRTELDRLISDFESHYAQLATSQVTFRIFNRRDGAPITNAAIVLTDQHGNQTDAPHVGMGTFILKRLSLGIYQYTAKASGFLSLMQEPVSKGMVLCSTDEADPVETIQMEPVPGELRLNVHDDRGSGVPSAAGMIEGKSGPPRSFKADDQGQAQIDNLSLGNYSIQMLTMGYHTASPQVGFRMDPVTPSNQTPQPVSIELIPYLSTVKVQVTDDRGLAIKDARLELGEQSGKTEGSGFFTFSSVRPSAKKELKAFKNGYLSSSITFDLRPISEGFVLTKKLILKGGIDLTINLADKEAGVPISGANVVISSSQTSGQAETNANGSVQFSGLPPDYIYASLSKPGYLSRSNVELDLHNVPKSGKKQFELKLQKGMSLNVFVQDEKQTLLPAAYVQLDQGPQYFVATGTLKLSPVKEGNHVIRATAPGYIEVLKNYRAQPELQSEDSLVFQLQPGFTLMGEVRNSDGYLFKEPAQIFLLQNGTQVASGPGPRHLFSDLTTGTYTLKVAAQGFETQTSTAISMNENQPSQTLAVVLQSQSTLKVVVQASTDNQTVIPDGVRVEVSGMGGSWAKNNLVSSFENLEAGTYRITATASGFPKKETSIALKQGASQTVTFHFKNQNIEAQELNPFTKECAQAKAKEKQANKPQKAKSGLNLPKKPTGRKVSDILGEFSFGKGTLYETYVYHGSGPLKSRVELPGYFWKGKDWNLDKTRWEGVKPLKLTFVAQENGVVRFHVTDQKPDELYVYQAGSVMGNYSTRFPDIFIEAYDSSDAAPKYKSEYKTLTNAIYSVDYHIRPFMFSWGQKTEASKEASATCQGTKTVWVGVLKGDKVIITLSPVVVGGNGADDGSDVGTYLRKYSCDAQAGKIRYEALYLE